MGAIIQRVDKGGRPSKEQQRRRVDFLRMEAQQQEKEERTIQVTRVFLSLKDAAGSKVVICRGGARSSKSHSISQLLIERLFCSIPRKILIVRKTLPALRVSIKAMVDEILSNPPYNLMEYVKQNKQLMNYYYGKSFIHFGSIDDPEKIKSSEWNDILMEEATDFTYEDFVNLKLRLSAKEYGVKNQLILSLNPIDEFHWIKTKLLDGGQEPNCVELLSNYKDNPYLSQDYIDVIENLQDIDENYWRIYGKGEWGHLEGMIYDNWKVHRAEDKPVEGETIYGLDFGFTNPTTLLQLKVDGMKALITQKLYKTNMTNDVLIEELKNIIPKERRSEHIIYADAAEPDRIEEISQAGFWCTACDKPTATNIGSVKLGIDFCKRHELLIEEGSTDVIKELRSYTWRKDRNGNPIEEPVKYNDHAMDAMRYALFSHNYSKPNIRSL